MHHLPALPVGHRDFDPLRAGETGRPADCPGRGVDRHARWAAAQGETQHSVIRVRRSDRVAVGIPQAHHAGRRTGDGWVPGGLEVRGLIVGRVVHSAGDHAAIRAAGGIPHPMSCEHRPDAGAVGTSVGRLVRRKDGVAGVSHAGVARRGFQAVHHELVGHRLAQGFAQVPQGGGPDLAVIVHLIPIGAVADIFIGERVAFVALPPETVSRVLGLVVAIDRIVVIADGEVVRPPFSHGPGLDLVQTAHVDSGSHQAVAHAVAVLVKRRLAGVVGIQIVGMRAGAARIQAHAKARRRAIRLRAEARVVGEPSVLGLPQHGVVPYPSPAEIVRLEIAGRLGETQAVVMIVRHVEKVEEVGHGGGLVISGIQPKRPVAESEVECLGGAVSPADLHSSGVHIVGTVVAVGVQVSVCVVAGGH